MVQYFLDRVKERTATPRSAETDTIRDVLLRNKAIAEQNAKYAKYRLMKSGLISESSVEKTQHIKDLGSNVPESNPHIIFDCQQDEDYEME